MLQILPFNDHVAEYEDWFVKYPLVFESEVMAIKAFQPKGENLRGLEVGTGTGRFADALHIQEAVEPADNMRLRAAERGITVKDAEAEHLPYPDAEFDYVVMAFCISYFNCIEFAFKEAMRILKPGGNLIVGFLDRDSDVGRDYEARRQFSTFYRDAIFYTPERVIGDLKRAGFRNFTFCQTLFDHLDNINEAQSPREGFGEGSFVVINALKRS